MPELLEMRLEAQQRMGRASAPFLGVVPDIGKLGLAIDGEDDGVQINGQRGSGLGYRKQLGPKLIVQGDKLADDLGRESLEESSQGGLIGKPRKSQEREEYAMVLQDLGLVDPSQTGHDGIKKGQDQIGGKRVGVALRNRHGILDKPAESERVAKTLNKHHPTEVSQMGVFEGYMLRSQAFGHAKREGEGP